MNRININRLKITIDTEDGVFGTDIPFLDGFNILRARNTRGKSSTLNAILYPLGIEELLGGKNAKTMKPALKDKLIYKEKEVAILESKVQLEISNQQGDIITLTRWIKSSGIDEKLIRVHFGPALTKVEELISKDFYVHMKGSAVEEAGFHTFLASFLGWNLPEVSTFEGGDRLLYIQTLFPLFFVEQNKGWSSFYVPISGSFGIRDLSKRAFEFMLNMDITKNAKEREELKVLKALYVNRWIGLKSSLQEIAETINGEVTSLPDKPILLEVISLNVYDKNRKLISIVDRIFELESSIKERENYSVKRISDVAGKYEKEVKEQDLLVLTLQSEINSIRQDLHLEKNNMQTMSENLKHLEIDLKRNQEAEKLYRLGAEIDSTFSHGICPTCHQHVEDTLMPPESSIQPLDLSENITFIKEQINTLIFGVKQSKMVIQSKETKLDTVTEFLNKARRELRLYKAELSENPKLPTQENLEKLVELKVLLSKLQEASNSFEKIENHFEQFKNEWRMYLSRLENLPKHYFSELDKKKLYYFEKEFLKLLRDFSFSSINTEEISISHDKYTPIVSGFDIKFDSSASDNIRLIWSYVIAMYKTNLKFAGNHPGLMVFDEPGQQQMAVKSQKQLFQVLSGTKGQSIVGTSLEPDEIKEMTKNLTVNIIDLGEDYIIKPIS
ncbi:hypothetical protein [Peribacillus sp. TH27]|uniref:hypothetical protein n=1 Tax=Peribacillus sp. TH27 TaxID=2798484 RepID=UPI001913016D|nr:hypothetical protein [Peribacillus sp. TH27]MBK5458947.1 hypothetical protein [Peribacillus sp. TH27]